MVPNRYSSLFRSRWRALFWAAGICWSAVSFTSYMTPEPDGAVTPANDATSLDDLHTLVAKIEP
jgi:hypothetical protein